MRVMEALLERERELAGVRDVIAAAHAGQGSVAVVYGPAGIGKSSLLRAATEDSRTLRATAGALEVDIPFEVVRSLLAGPVGRAPASERDRLLSGPARQAAPLLGLADAAADSDASGALHGLFWLVQALAETEPLVLVVDDVQWADEPSRRFLSFLARRLEDTPIALLLGLRSTESTPETDEILHLPATRRIEPSPLSDAAAARLAGDVPADIIAAAAGNPFLIVSGTRGPDGLAAAVARRMAEIGPGARETGEAVALLAGAADVTAVADLAAIPAQHAVELLDRLSEAGLIEPGPPPRPAHPLIADALLAGLGPAERAGAHGRAARALGRLGADPERVASHLLAAPPCADRVAVAWLRRAAEASARAGAPDAAASFLERALSEPPDDAERPELHFELGTVLTRAGRQAGVEHLSIAFAAATSLERRVDIGRQIALISGFMTSADFDFVQRLLSEIPPGRGAEALQLRAGELFMRMLFLGADEAQRVEQIRGALSAGGIVDRFAASVLALHGALSGGPVAQIEHDSLTAIGTRAEYDAALASGWPMLAAHRALATVGRGTQQTADQLEHVLASVRSRGSVLGALAAGAAAAQVALSRGRVRDAVDHAGAAVAAGDGLRLDAATSMAQAQLAMAQTLRGELDGAERSLADVPATLPETGVAGTSVALARAELLAARGKARAARSAFERLGEVCERTGLSSAGMICWRSGFARVLLGLGETAAAREVAEADVAAARRSGAPLALARALRTAALAGDAGSRAAGLREALDAIDDADLELERATTLTELGAHLRRTNERVASREHLTQALDLAGRLGATALATRAREELLASGARPRRDRRWGLDALTPSELRVARLAAQGLSNREIAADLFVVPKTVETHLSRIYRKLDLAGREGLAAALDT